MDFLPCQASIHADHLHGVLEQLSGQQAQVGEIEREAASVVQAQEQTRTDAALLLLVADRFRVEALQRFEPGFF